VSVLLACSERTESRRLTLRFQRLRLAQAPAPALLDPGVPRAVAPIVPRVDHETTANGDAPAWLGGRAEKGQASMGDGADGAAVVARALAGDQEAFGLLQASAERVVRGFVRPRVRTDEDADDLLQDLWVQIWQKLSTYDPARASFPTFAKFWADLLVRRYWASPRGRRLELAASGLGGDPEDGEEDASGTDRLDRLANQGGGIYPPPDDPVDADVYDDLLRVTLATASPPHQLVAFGFVKAANWRPRRIAAELSSVPLRALVQALEVAYREQSELPAERIAPAFAPLRDRIEQRFDEAVRDATTLSIYPALHQRIVGETVLTDYYTGDPTADITQWWYAVKRRVLAEVQRRPPDALAGLLRRTVQPSRRSPAGESVRKGASRRTNG
jgi:DNA-directed RNA polymerase specialized sigma24 family protein